MINSKATTTLTVLVGLLSNTPTVTAQEITAIHFSDPIDDIYSADSSESSSSTTPMFSELFHDADDDDTDDENSQGEYSWSTWLTSGSFFTQPEQPETISVDRRSEYAKMSKLDCQPLITNGHNFNFCTHHAPSYLHVDRARVLPMLDSTNAKVCNNGANFDSEIQTLELRASIQNGLFGGGDGTDRDCTAFCVFGTRANHDDDEQPSHFRWSRMSQCWSKQQGADCFGATGSEVTYAMQRRSELCPFDATPTPSDSENKAFDMTTHDSGDGSDYEEVEQGMMIVALTIVDVNTDETNNNATESDDAMISSEIWTVATQQNLSDYSTSTSTSTSQSNYDEANHGRTYLRSQMI